MGSTFAKRPRRPNASSPPSQAEGHDGVKSELHAFKLETVVLGLEVVGYRFSARSRALVTEKPGRLRIIETARMLPRTGRRRPCRPGQGPGRAARFLRCTELRDQWMYLLSYSDPGPAGPR